MRHGGHKLAPGSLISPGAVQQLSEQIRPHAMSMSPAAGERQGLRPRRRSAPAPAGPATDLIMLTMNGERRHR